MDQQKQLQHSNWLMGGVNFSIPGEGGQECADFISVEQRLTETILFTTASWFLAKWAWKNIPSTDLKSISNNNNSESHIENRKLDELRKLILLSLSLVFGIEIGFKLSTRQVIWLLNPCHVLTAIQCYILSRANSSISGQYLMKLHVYWLSGPLLAILFPVTSTRLLPGEVAVYWIQHGLIMIIPLLLMIMDKNGSVSHEPQRLQDVLSSELPWSMLALAILSLYHWLVLQPLGLITLVNLNNMLCPAASDPFYSPYYRIIAMGYFVILLPLVGSLYSIAGFYLNRASIKQD